jgi:hypothetical protein
MAESCCELAMINTSAVIVQNLKATTPSIMLSILAEEMVEDRTLYIAVSPHITQKNGTDDLLLDWRR